MKAFPLHFYCILCIANIFPIRLSKCNFILTFKNIMFLVRYVTWAHHFLFWLNILPCSRISNAQWSLNLDVSVNEITSCVPYLTFQNWSALLKGEKFRQIGRFPNFSLARITHKPRSGNKTNGPVVGESYWVLIQ